MAKKICTKCGYYGKETKHSSGTFLLEIMLWIVGLFLWPLLIIALLYSLWRFGFKKKVCPKCREASMIPADTPVGQELIQKFNIKLEK